MIEMSVNEEFEKFKDLERIVNSEQDDFEELMAQWTECPRTEEYHHMWDKLQVMHASINSKLEEMETLHAEVELWDGLTNQGDMIYN